MNSAIATPQGALPVTEEARRPDPSGKMRTRRYRQRLRGQRCQRLEFLLGDAVAGDLRTIAGHRGVTLRHLIQEACQDIVTRYNGVLASMKRFQTGRG